MQASQTHWTLISYRSYVCPFCNISSFWILNCGISEKTSAITVFIVIILNPNMIIVIILNDNMIIVIILNVNIIMIITVQII